jgi:hypothetical protein
MAMILSSPSILYTVILPDPFWLYNLPIIEHTIKLLSHLKLHKECL